MTTKRKSYPPKTKHDALDELKGGASYSDVSTKYGVPISTLSTWQSKAAPAGLPETKEQAPPSTPEPTPTSTSLEATILELETWASTFQRNADLLKLLKKWQDIENA